MWLCRRSAVAVTARAAKLPNSLKAPSPTCKAAINRFLEEHNQQSKPFAWTKDPDQIIAAVKRGHQVLDSIH